jgi:hydrogenase maturation protease
MSAYTKDSLILGIGNDILTDDGIGPKIVQKLHNEFKGRNITLLTTATGGLELLELIKDYKKVIIIDAIRTEGGTPGTIYYLTPSNFKETLHISSFHDVSFHTALKLADKLDIPVPEKIDIIAIEILEDLTFSSEFSKPIAHRFNKIFQEVKDSILNILQLK